MDFLHMTKHKVQVWFEGALPSAADKIVVGAAIIRTRENGDKEILLLKRAAHEANYPGIFEIPGGKVDEADKSVRDALSREVFEDTGFTISRVVDALNLFTYTAKKQSSNEPMAQTIRKLTLQLSYLVEVQGHGDDFVVNPDEHSGGTWATADQVPTLPMTAKMREIVLEALWAAAQ